MTGALKVIQEMRTDLSYYDYLLPGDWLPEPPMRRTWYGRRVPMAVTQEMIEWAGGVARARVLMDLAWLEKELSK